MTFQQLEYIVEVFKCGSLNQAASRLFISQTGISVAIRSLEKELGTSLLIRSRRGVVFTEEGKRFVSYAVSLLEQKKRIEDLFYSSGKTCTPATLSVSMQRFTFCIDAFANVVNKINDHQFSISCHEDNMDTVIEDVFNHRADVGVISLSKYTEEFICHFLKTKNIEFTEIASVRPCIFVHKGHPLTNRTEIEGRDLVKYPFICYAQNGGIAQEFAEEYPLITAQKPLQTISTNSSRAAGILMCKVNGFTIGSGLVGDYDKSIISIPLAEDLRIRIGYIVPRNQPLSPLANEYIKQLKKTLGQSISLSKKKYEALSKKRV